MPLNLEQVTSDLITMGIGGLTTGFLWVIRTILKLQRDLDAAHIKIRRLNDRDSTEDRDCTCGQAPD
jgi:hypothetical protein